MGAPPDVIDRARQQAQASEQAEDFEVWPDCLAAVEFFTSLRGQWRHVSGMTTARTGLDFAAVQAAMDMHPIPQRRRPQLFQDVVLMESAVLTVDHERREKRAQQGAK